MFSSLITQLLRERNMSAYRLSKELNISESVISSWKRGTLVPGYNSIKKLADYFDVSADYLLERTDNHVGEQE